MPGFCERSHRCDIVMNPEIINLISAHELEAHMHKSDHYELDELESNDHLMTNLWLQL